MGEHHGCPYKTFDKASLSGLLSEAGVPQSSIPQIVAKAADGHFQIACGMTFEAKNQEPCDGIMHPNQYARLSRVSVVASPPDSGDLGSLCCLAFCLRSAATPTETLARLIYVDAPSVQCVVFPSPSSASSSLPRPVRVHCTPSEVVEGPRHLV